MSSRPGTRATTRLFFALWPDDSVRAELVRLQRTVLPARARAVAAANLHLTLLFAGDCDEARAKRLMAAAADLRPGRFDLVLDRPRLVRRSGIVWTEASELPALLLALAEGLRSAALAAGAPVDRRAFTAHVTLARRADSLGAAAYDRIAWCPERFGLYASELRPGGAEYRRVAEWPLAAG